MLDSHASVRKTAANMYRKHQLREESWVIAENDFVYVIAIYSILTVCFH